MKIDPSAELPPIRLSEQSEPTAQAGDATFGDLLARGISDANRMQAAADAKTAGVVRGASDDLHGTMITVKEADIAMKLVGSVRNRLLDAFHELWRINL